MSNVAGALDDAPPGRTALLFDGRRITYGELSALIGGCAGVLEARGVGPGSVVATLLPNSPAYVATYFAALRVGATVAPLGVLLRPREVRERVAVAGARVLVASEPVDVPGVDLVVLDRAGGPPAPAPRPATAREDGDVAVIVFTSGTTGAPKGAEITHGGLAWNAAAIVDAFALVPEDVQLAVAPLSHVLGMTGVMNATLLTGGAVALMERFDAARALQLMREHGVTGLMGAPPMFIALTRAAREAGAPVRLRYAHGGGAAFPGPVVRGVEEAFGCPVRAGYGMSEVGGGITVTPLRAAPKDKSVGRAFPGSELRVVDLISRAPVAPGEPGEVQVRSPSVMRGYRDDPQATREVLDADGWLSTGDVGYLDEDGDLFLVDRRKELIIRGGYNVYPGEVEEVLYSCPGVSEAAVIGVPHPEHGEEVVAVVVPEDDALEPGEVIAFAREQLAAYKYPRHVVLVDELPKTPTGKVAKRAIDRERLLRTLTP